MGLWSGFPKDRGCEVLGIALLALTFFLFFALVSSNYQGVVSLDDMGNAFNLCGRPGALVSGFLYVLLGYAAHLLYFITCVWALMLFRHRPLDRFLLRLVGMVALAASIAGLLHVDLFTTPAAGLPGGVIGAQLGDLLLPIFGVIGTHVITLTLSLVGILLATEFLFVRGAQLMVLGGVHMLRTGIALLDAWRSVRRERRQRNTMQQQRLSAAAQAVRGVGKEFRAKASPGNGGNGIKVVTSRAEKTEPPVPSNGGVEELSEKDLSRIRVRTQVPKPEPVQEEMPFDTIPGIGEAAPVLGKDFVPACAISVPDALAASPMPDSVLPEIPVLRAPIPRAAAPRPPMPRRKTAELDELPADYVYPRRFKKPPLDLLDNPPVMPASEGLAEQLRQTAVLLEKALETFGIEARVTDITRGPTITRFELEPAPGIKVNRFTSLADDLALALKAHGVRVEAPIPGKGRIGIELPNTDREPVVLRELLQSKTFRKQKAPLTLALGKDITGEVVTANLASMPHLLIAGATGTGKTVSVKSILSSLLFTYTPEELQLMLVDPKMVELSILNEIPHLITPVVTDPKKAAAALHWLIVEMEERYRMFAQLRVRNIEVYNESVENGEIEIPSADGEEGESVDIVRKLPYIVCVIDELADLMMLARAEVEDAIMRLAQLARAVGIHLIIATQRPSVNVLTGVIKANFPVRISFQVSSRTDSRCILDEIGAERLIGKGDMLYLPAGKATPTRIQGAFVSDHEMNALIAYLKTQAPPQYRDEIASFGKTPEQMEDLIDAEDDLFDDAVRVVLETGQASISMVQRRLRVGYTRAARLIDMMEVRGIVGPHVGSKAREILVGCAPADRST